MKPCLETRSDKSACTNIFLELPLKLIPALSWNECNIILLIIYNYDFAEFRCSRQKCI